MKINKTFFGKFFFIFYLLKYNFCFVQKIYKGNKKHNNYISFRKEERTQIFGNINELNYYYINLYLGKGRKKQSFLLDTGSGITSIPCKPYCTQCGQHKNSYLFIENNQILDCNDKKCSSVESKCNEEKNICSFTVHYYENSLIKGFYFNELINLSNEQYKDNKLIPIGCTTYEDNFFYTQKVDGIMGLCNNGNNFIDILYKYGLINNNIFSLCFGKKGGYMTLGEIETRYHNEKIYFIDNDKNKYYYTLNINGIKINNQTISDETYPGIIDSGLTIAKMPIKILNQIINYINKLSNKKSVEYFIHQELGSCYKFNSYKDLNYSVSNIWPFIEFDINNYKYIWKPKQYLFEYSENGKIFGCFGFNKNGANKFNLGASWMIGHDIIFDNKNSRIGFVEADCKQGDSLNNGEEDDDIPLYNDNINISNNNYSKYLFTCYIIIIIVLAIIKIILCVCVVKLKNGKNCWFIHSKHINIFNDINADIKNELKNKNSSLDTLIEMNNNSSEIRDIK